MRSTESDADPVERPSVAFQTGLKLCCLALSVFLLVEGERFLDPDSGTASSAALLTDEDREAYYAFLAQDLPGIWEAIPEPHVARLLQPRIRKSQTGAEVVSNAAGMRSERPYTPKRDGVFRIVCLGDSMVFGEGGLERDRFGDQMEQFFRQEQITVDGKRIEVYSVGLGGWTALNEATYLASRISEYQPDLLLVLTVTNDISDAPAVSGLGQLTSIFTPDHRDLGSGVFTVQAARLFQIKAYNALVWGLGPESVSRYARAFDAWKRLEDLVRETGGQMVFAVLGGTPVYTALCKHWFAEKGLTSPFVVTSTQGHRLPHDGHPDREGHALLANHLLNVIAEAGYVPIQEEQRPPMPPGLRLTAVLPAAPDRLAELQHELVGRFLIDQIDFEQDFRPMHVMAMLGGIFPEARAQPLEAPPLGTLKSAFLLSRREGAARLHVEVEVPARAELFPFELALHADGQRVATLSLQHSSEAGRHVLVGELPASSSGPALEVMLSTRSYWCELKDHRMKSYRLLSARQD